MTTTITSRDKRLLGVFAVVLLLGILGMWYPKAKQAWTTHETTAIELEGQLATEQMIIAQRDAAAKRYAELRKQIPTFPENKDVVNYWWATVDNIATANGVNIATRSAGREMANGEVIELTLECREWSANLESLINFLYAVETHPQTMMDVRSIKVDLDKKRPGFLKGSFTINCAYMRE